MTLRIVLEGLAVDAVIGIHDWERRVRQRLRIDVELEVDGAAAAASDAIADAVDYTAVAACIREHCASSDARLVERLGSELIDLLRERFSPTAVHVAVHKPGAVDDCDDLALHFRG